MVSKCDVENVEKREPSYTIESESHSVMSDSLQPHLEVFWPEYWSGQPFPSSEDLPDPVIKPGSPALQVDFYQLGYQGSPKIHCWGEYKLVLQTLQKTVQRLLKVKIELPYDPAVSTSVYIQKRYMLPSFITSIFTKEKTWKQPKSPSTGE